MIAIYTSKFYKASKRQNEIRAAVENPINRELVLQLKEYIDDEEMPDVSDSEPKEVKNDSVTKSEQKSDDIPESKFTPRSSSSKIPPADHHLSDMLKDEEDNSDIPQEVPSAEFEKQRETEEETVSESTDVQGNPVVACVDFSTQTDSVVGILNANAETSGVRRCMVKPEDELWIYYNDSINLNNVMEPVISLLNAADYGHLDFNRLARTDNAIVFSISESLKPVEPIAETDEGK